MSQTLFSKNTGLDERNTFKQNEAHQRDAQQSGIERLDIKLNGGRKMAETSK